MKLSIIIAYYNAEKFIFPLLESLQDQGFQQGEYEILLVDDGSTNDVSELKNYISKSSAIKYLWQENARASAARNNGIKIAKGEYIYFIDNDDLVQRQVLSLAYEKASENQLDILFFNRCILKENEIPPTTQNNFDIKEIISGQQYYGKNPDMSMGHWSYMIRKQYIDDNALEFPLGVINVDDVSYTLDALLSANRVAHIDVDVYYWIQHPQSLSRYLGKKKMSEQYNNEKIWFVKKFKNTIESRKLESSCVLSLKRQIEKQKFSLLHNSLRFMSVNESKAFIKELRSIGEYPFGNYDNYKGYYAIIYKIMNCYPLWILCCKLYSILPYSIKQKF